MKLLPRLLVLVLALLMPAGEVLAAGCDTPGSHHDGSVAAHEEHGTPGDAADHGRHAPPATGCPMKAPCTAPAVQPSCIVRFPQAQALDPYADDAAVEPSGIEASLIPPPPRPSA